MNAYIAELERALSEHASENLALRLALSQYDPRFAEMPGPPVPMRKNKSSFIAPRTTTAGEAAPE